MERDAGPEVRAAGLVLRFSATDEAFLGTDARGHVTTLNAEACRLCGWSEAEARGRPLWEILRLLQDQEPVKDPFALLLGSNSVHDGALQIQLDSRQGERRPVSCGCGRIEDSSGRLAAAFVTLRDLSAQRGTLRREHFLAELASQTQALTDPADIIPLAMRLLAEHLDVQHCAYTEVHDDALQQHRGDAQGTPPFTRVGWEQALLGRLQLQCLRADQPMLIQDCQADPRIDPADLPALRAADIQALLCLPLQRRGRCIAVLSAQSAAPRQWSNEEVMLLRTAAGRCWEALERAQSARRLRQSEEKFRDLADNISQLAWMADAKGRRFWYNRRWLEYTGTTLESMLERAWTDQHHPEHAERVERRLAHCIRHGEAWEDTFPLRGRDGAYRWFLSRALPIRDAQGCIERWFGTSTDITQQRELEEELRHVAARLTEMDQRKDEFLATLAHELRNPLAPIRTGLEVMRLAGDDWELVEQVRCTLERQTGQLIKLVDDLLDVSRITRGKLKLCLGPSSLREVVRTAVETTRPLIEEARHQLRLRLPAEDLSLNADPHRLTQVLANLLNNACQYTPQGGRIELAVARQRDELHFTVRDSGIGIPLSQQESIFEMFTQIAAHGLRSYTGLGIGLTLARSLVEMHGGRIQVSSPGQNRGSEFRVILPLLPLPAPPLPRDEQTTRGAPAASCRVLVVDDNQAAAETLAMILSLQGSEVRSAGNGQEAVVLAESFGPDVVFMDLGMPVMNGYEAARHIREQSWGREMLLVALTGWGQEEDRRRTRQAGFDEHLVKPADPAQLQQLIKARRERKAAQLQLWLPG